MIDQLCPCGSGHPYRLCCAPLLAGEQTAATAEVLMRSRYTAFVRGDIPYLLRTWHSRTRPIALDLTDQPAWERLEIVRTAAGAAGDREGLVEFKAYFRTGNQSSCLHEVSRFLREQEHWFYLDGQQKANTEPAPGRNAPCPCGSGKKFKRCCGR